MVLTVVWHAQDDSKPELYDHPLAPEHVLLRAPRPQRSVAR